MCSGDLVVEMTRPLNRLYPVQVESQVREERQNRNTDFPITFVENAEQEQVSEQLTIKSKKGELFCLHLLFYSFRLLIDLCQSRQECIKKLLRHCGGKTLHVI